MRRVPEPQKGSIEVDVLPSIRRRLGAGRAGGMRSETLKEENAEKKADAGSLRKAHKRLSFDEGANGIDTALRPEAGGQIPKAQALLPTIEKTRSRRALEYSGDDKRGKDEKKAQAPRDYKQLIARFHGSRAPSMSPPCGLTCFRAALPLAA